jgi:hypothetical protein
LAKKIMQFRYYAKGDEKNSPHYITIAGLTTGQILRDFLPMSHLGIQTLPGTKFYLNGNTYPVIVGHSGLYELELNDKMRITSLSFDGQSIKAIEENPNGYLIIDCIYEGV